MTEMNRRNFLKYTTVGATLPLTVKAAWLSQPVPDKHLVAYIELFGKRWPIPIEIFTENNNYRIDALADITFNIQNSGIVPRHIPVFLPTEVRQRLPEWAPDRILLDTCRIRDTNCFPGDILVLSFDNKRGLAFLTKA